MNIQRRTLVAATIAAGLPLPALRAGQDRARLRAGRRRKRMAHRQHRVDQVAAKDAGIELKFSDAQQKQENQIKAIRSYIAQKVDVIAFSPVVESGWDTVLREAKDAKIPVILTDRAVDVKDDSALRDASSAPTSSRKAAAPAAGWSRTRRTEGPVNIVELQGTVGSAPANDRKKGFEEIIKTDPKFKIIRSQSGDFTRAKGKEVMEAFLKTDGKKINVLYAHNDDMALGAIQAIEEAGMKPGKDITIVSIDAIKGAFEAMIAGKINVRVECSPLLGPQLMPAVKDVVGRQDAAQAHRDGGRHLPDGGGGQGVPDAASTDRRPAAASSSRRRCRPRSARADATFPGVHALSGVDFRLYPGEVHTLMGQNGAGKSTLIKVLTGVYPPDAGELRLDGEPDPPAVAAGSAAAWASARCIRK